MAVLLRAFITSLIVDGLGGLRAGARPRGELRVLGGKGRLRSRRMAQLVCTTLPQLCQRCSAQGLLSAAPHPPPLPVWPPLPFVDRPPSEVKDPGRQDNQEPCSNGATHSESVRASTELAPIRRASCHPPDDVAWPARHRFAGPLGQRSPLLWCSCVHFGPGEAQRYRAVQLLA